MWMNLLTITFLVVMAIFYCISMRQVWNARFLEAYLLRPETGEEDRIPVVEIEDKYFIPALIGGLLVIAWCLIWPYPYLTIQFLTPSYATSGWLWTTVAAYLVGLPFGTILAFIGMMLVDARPEGKLMAVLSFLVSGVAMGLAIWMLIEVYKFWLIWVPIVTGALFCTLLKKNTLHEALQHEKRIEEEEKRRREHQAWVRDYTRRKNADRAARNQARANELANRGWVPERYSFLYHNNKWYELTQDRKTSSIHFTDQYGHRWEKMGDKFTPIDFNPEF